MTRERMCSGCRQHKPKEQLLRVVRSKEGVVSVDGSGKKPGRGAYICCDAACFKRIRKSRALERGLNCQISAEIYDELETLINGAE